MSDQVLFVIMPLLSATALVVAGTWRLTREHSDAARAMSATPARDGAGRYASTLIAAVLIGHVVMLAWPQRLLTWASTLSRLIALEAAYIALGVVATATLGVAIGRALRINGGRKVGDAMFTGVLLVTLVSGVGVAVLNRWALGWSAAILTPYVQSLVALQPQTNGLEGMPYLVRLHVFSSFLLVALVPFSSVFDAVQRAWDAVRMTIRVARAMLDQNEGVAATNPPEWSAPTVARRKT